MAFPVILILHVGSVRSDREKVADFSSSGNRGFHVNPGQQHGQYSPALYHARISQLFAQYKVGGYDISSGHYRFASLLGPSRGSIRQKTDIFPGNAYFWNRLSFLRHFSSDSMVNHISLRPGRRRRHDDVVGTSAY